MKNVFKISFLRKTKEALFQHVPVGYSLLILCFFLLVVSILLTSPRVPTPFRFFSVQSGSMYPSLKEGDLIITRVQEEYQVGDVITFLSPEDNQEAHSTTHRIVEVYALEEPLFKTKGDANLVPDQILVRKGTVLGMLVWSIPFLGFLIDWVKTPLGLTLAIFLPCVAIVVTELRRIQQELSRP